ncbi:AAA family ATPase [Fodinicola feengrottensis]|uniref:AAA family ATPase n=1 Tax=Fodinicola feengrottensis TaxID=435914 RepID=UPI0024431733|nr:AAA family ATPase [Fodinicola feengrottensis]
MPAGAAADELVGREKEVDLLDRELDALGGGRTARTVELVGEPGIGKTRLMHSARLSARQRGHLVLAGRATEFEQPIPFAVIVDALDDHLSELSEEVLTPLGAERLGLLATVFPAVAAWVPLPAGNGLVTERYRMHRAIRALLELLAAPAGLLLMLDDVHWADPASIELLEHLRRHPPRAPLLIVMGYRPSQVPARLVAPMAGDDAGLIRVELGPLSVTDVNRLLGPDASPGRGRLLHRESGGNPFYLHALRSAPVDPLTGMPAVSGASRQVIGAELAALSPLQALVANAAAVAGDPVDPQLISVVTELDLAETLEILDQLTARDLLRVTEDGRRTHYRHPLVRHVAYICAPASWRLGAHRRAAAALARRPGDTAALLRAQHLVRSADPGDTETVEVLRWAAGHTGTYAPATAAHFLAAALRLTPDTPASAAERRELRIALASALTSDGRFDEARDLIRGVLGWIPAGHHEQRVRAVLLAAQVERLLGRNEVARLLLTDELGRMTASEPAQAEPGPAAVAIEELKLEVARSAVNCAVAADDRPLLTGIADFARTHGLTSLEAAAVGVHAVSAHAIGDREEAVRLTDQAAALVDSLPDEELARHPHAASRLAAAEIDLGRLESAVAHAERGLTVARRSGRSYLVIQMGVTLTVAYRKLGRLPEGAGLHRGHGGRVRADRQPLPAWHLALPARGGKSRPRRGTGPPGARRARHRRHREPQLVVPGRADPGRRGDAGRRQRRRGTGVPADPGLRARRADHLLAVAPALRLPPAHPSGVAAQPAGGGRAVGHPGRGDRRSGAGRPGRAGPAGQGERAVLRRLTAPRGGPGQRGGGQVPGRHHAA